MNYYIENVEHMNDDLRQATAALYGFNSMVMNIEEKKAYGTTNNIKEVSKIHCIRYIENGNKLRYHVWRYHDIGDGIQCDIGPVPLSLNNEVTMQFKYKHLLLGKASSSKLKKIDIIYCSETLCVKSFSSVDVMLKHSNFGKHEFGETSSRSMKTFN